MSKNPFEPPQAPLERQPQATLEGQKSYLLLNIISAMYASLPQLVGGGAALVLGAYLLIGGIVSGIHEGAAIQAIIICVPMGLATIAIAVMQFRTAWRLLREASRLTSRRIQLPRKASIWGDFVGAERIGRRHRLPDDFDPTEPN
ncbi:MAG TPA: hypothetical protein VIK18_02610 [Pirellulales bacterium]